ncbi:MAG: hypothetical protein ACREUG_02500 [Steroidobacteraceae bacterium]
MTGNHPNPPAAESAEQIPGPWRAAPYSSIVGCGVVGPRGMIVAAVPGPKEHAEPIAKLIAATPDLYAALKRLDEVVLATVSEDVSHG